MPFTVWAGSFLVGSGESITGPKGYLMNVDYWKCENCEESFDPDNEAATAVRQPYSLEQDWCSGCVDGGAWVCERCDGVFSSAISHLCSSNCELIYCERCSSNANWWWCDDCSDWTPGGDECACGRYQNGNAMIHSWDYRPHYIKHGDGRFFMGVELEVEAADNADDLAVLCHAHDPDEVRHFQKHDGSLSEGLEIVSMPHTLAEWYLYGDEYARLLKTLHDHGARSWSRSSCGLHVHISRTAFRSASHLLTFSLFVSRNEQGLTRFAGRRSSYASFSGLQDGSLVSKVKNLSGQHFDALNLGNSSTVEFRIFRPSLAVGRVFAALELCAALVEYTRYMRAHDVALGALSWDRFESWVVGSTSYSYARHSMSGGRFTPSNGLASSMTYVDEEV